MSRRTDGADHYVQKSLSIPTGADGQWGDRADLDAIQAGSPLAGQPEPAGLGAVSAGGVAPTPLGAPSERPDEDVTTFTPPTGQPTQTDEAAQLIRSLYAARPTPKLRALVNLLEAEGR